MAQDGTYGAGVHAGQAQGQGDQFVVAGGDRIKDDAFEDGHAVLPDCVMGRHGFGFLRIERGRIDADQAHAVPRQQGDGFRRDGGKCRIPFLLRGLGVGAQQYARRRIGQCVRDILRPDRRSADAMDHAAGADIGVQRHLVYRRALGIVMAGGIAVGAGMGGKRDAADVHRAAVGDFPGGLGAEGRVAGPDRDAGGKQWADVPDLLCGSDGFLLWPD